MEREEAIRRIKAWNLDSDDMEVLATAIPELKENEDERIRMALIKLMTVAGENYVRSATGFEKEQLIAYLEKQQERNVVPSRETILGICWKEDPEEREGLTQLQYIQKYWNEKCDYQNEQKPINNSTREKIISRATSEKQVVLLSESNGNAEIGWDTRSLEDAKKLLEYGIAFINERLGTKPAECGDDEKIRKGLIQHLKELRNWKVGTLSPIKVPAHYDAWITYLEKQQGRKPGATINGEPIPTENQSVNIPLAEWSDTDNIGWDEAFACVTRAEKSAKNEEELQNAVTAEKWLKEIKEKMYALARKEVEYDVSACGRRGRMGGVPREFSEKAEEYQKGIKPPYDADDIISAYESGMMEEEKEVEKVYKTQDVIFRKGLSEGRKVTLEGLPKWKYAELEMRSPVIKYLVEYEVDNGDEEPTRIVIPTNYVEPCQRYMEIDESLLRLGNVIDSVDGR